MKKLLLYICILFSGNTFAQLYTGTFAPNWSGANVLDTNIHYSLYDVLNQDKAVVMDISEVWCQPCWEYHESGILKDVFLNYGPHGTDQLRVFMLESNPTTRIEHLTTTKKLPDGRTSYGDWTIVPTTTLKGADTLYVKDTLKSKRTGKDSLYILNLPYPIINYIDMDAHRFRRTYNVNTFPTLYIITPDRTLHRIDPRFSTAAEFKQYLDNVYVPKTNGTDMKVRNLLGINTEICKQPTPTIVLQNYGTDTIKSFDVTLYIDNVSVFSKSWTGKISTYDSVNIHLPELNLTKGEHTYKAVVTNPNGTTDLNHSNDTLSADFTYALDKTEITIEWKFDNSPDETTWSLKSGISEIISDKYSSLYLGKESASQTSCIKENTCFKLVVNDSYGDGIGNGGYIKVKQDWFNLLTVEGDFGKGKSFDVCTNLDGVDALEQQAENINLYPNPASEEITITNSKGALIEVYSVVGQLKQSTLAKTDNQAINISQLTKGIYLVKITKNNELKTLKLQVN